MKGATECINVSWVLKFQFFSTKVGLFLDKEIQNAFAFIMDISFNSMGEFFDKKRQNFILIRILHITLKLSRFIVKTSCQKLKPIIKYQMSFKIS